MSIHYKFKSTLDFDTITFDGLHISVGDLKKSIAMQKRLGKITDFALRVVNAQTKQEYKDDSCLIPKNTSLIISRIPLQNQMKKNREVHSDQNLQLRSFKKVDSVALDIHKMEGSEEDKIHTMMVQSTADYDPKSYQKVKGQTQTGDVPSGYVCNKCKKSGHWIKNCPFILGKEQSDIRRNTGIPRSFRDKEDKTINTEISEQTVLMQEKQTIPEDLICGICKDLFSDAVMIPCCGSSFCDDCVRSALLESEENECPDCKEKGCSPGSLIPNRFLRNSVNVFKNETDYKTRNIKRDELNKTPEIEKNEIISGEKISEKEAESIHKGSNSTNEDLESDFEDNIIVTMPSIQFETKQKLIQKQAISNNVTPTHIAPTIENYKKNSLQISSIHHFNNSTKELGTNLPNWNQMADNHNLEKLPTNRMYEVSRPQKISGTLINSNFMGNFPPSDIRNRMQRHPNTSEIYTPPTLDMFTQNSRDLQGGNNILIQSHHITPYQNMHGNIGTRPTIGCSHFASSPVYPDRNSYIRASLRDVHQPVQFNNLANTFTNEVPNINSGVIDDPLEAFNRIMKEKEKRKAELRRTPERKRSRSTEKYQYHSNYRYLTGSQRSTFWNKTRKKTNRYQSTNRRYSNNSFSDRSSRSKSRSKSPYRKRSQSPKYRSRSRSKNRFDQARFRIDKTYNSQGHNEFHNDAKKRNQRQISTDPYIKKDTKGDLKSPYLTYEPPPPGFEVSNFVGNSDSIQKTSTVNSVDFYSKHEKHNRKEYDEREKLSPLKKYTRKAKQSRTPPLSENTVAFDKLVICNERKKSEINNDLVDTQNSTLKDIKIKQLSNDLDLPECSNIVNNDEEFEDKTEKKNKERKKKKKEKKSKKEKKAKKDRSKKSHKSIKTEQIKSKKEKTTKQHKGNEIDADANLFSILNGSSLKIKESNQTDFKEKLKLNENVKQENEPNGQETSKIQHKKNKHSLTNENNAELNKKISEVKNKKEMQLNDANSSNLCKTSSFNEAKPDTCKQQTSANETSRRDTNFINEPMKKNSFGDKNKEEMTFKAKSFQLSEPLHRKHEYLKKRDDRKRSNSPKLSNSVKKRLGSKVVNNNNSSLLSQNCKRVFHSFRIDQDKSVRRRSTDYNKNNYKESKDLKVARQTKYAAPQKQTEKNYSFDGKTSENNFFEKSYKNSNEKILVSATHSFRKIKCGDLPNVDDVNTNSNRRFQKKTASKCDSYPNENLIAGNKHYVSDSSSESYSNSKHLKNVKKIKSMKKIENDI